MTDPSEVFFLVYVQQFLSLTNQLLCLEIIRSHYFEPLCTDLDASKTTKIAQELYSTVGNIFIFDKLLLGWDVE